MPPSILVIDADPDVCDLLAVKLGHAGYQVTTTHSGEAGLRLARRLHPALVLLDWQLPGVDGLEVTWQLGGDPATAAIPVVMLSAYPDPDYQQRARAAGAVGYVVKPFSPTALAELVTSTLDQQADAPTPTAGQPAGAAALRGDGLAWLAQQAERPSEPGGSRAS